MKIRQLIVILSVLFLTLPLYAAKPDTQSGVNIMPKTFEYEGHTYKFDTRYPERRMTFRRDLDGDGKVETLVGFQGVAGDDILGLSFVAIGREANGKFTPEVIVSGNDRFDKVEFKDVDNDKVDEIVFWSTGGMHYISLDVYKLTKTGLKTLFHNGSACGVDIEGDSFPFKIKVGREKWEEPGWSYAAGTDLFEVYEWNGKELAYNKEHSTSEHIGEEEATHRYVEKAKSLMKQKEE